MKNSTRSSRFHEGQKVRVVTGTKDPDFGFPIEGWSGSIEDIVLSEDVHGTWLYCIRWDANTLKAMNIALYEMCEEENLESTRMFLAEHELDVA